MVVETPLAAAKRSSWYQVLFFMLSLLSTARL